MLAGASQRRDPCTRSPWTAAWRSARDRPFAEQVPEPKHQAAQCHAVCAPDPRVPTPIAQGLEMADQMAPAQLVPIGRQGLVRTMAIRAHNPGIVHPQQVAERGSIATGGHRNAGGHGGHHDLAPAPFPGFFPARFVDVAAVFLLDGGVK